MSFSHKNGDSVITGDFSKLEKLIKNLGKKYYVDIGILGAGSYEGGATIAGIGVVHEFGAEINVTEKMRGYLHYIGIHLKPETTVVRIPERSFIRMPLEYEQHNIEKDVQKVLGKKLEKADIEGIFKIIGLAGENAINDAFDSGGYGEWPDIKQITKDNKGSSGVLIDEGFLRKSITSKVSKI